MDSKLEYHRLVDTLYTINQERKIQFGLENTRALIQHHAICCPSRFKTIHVAGTNGKGSVTTKLARAVQAGGYRVGLFTSPHLISFRERIQVDGKMISEEEIVLLLTEIIRVAEHHKIYLTFFEFTTVLAFAYFNSKGCEFAVVEVGMGGRLDSTNVITPEVAVITSIGLDHCHVLGHTVEEICLEKCGIVKRRVPLVIGPSVPESVVREVVETVGTRYHRVETTDGDYDVENSGVAKQAYIELLQLGKFPRLLPDHDPLITQSLAARPPCRFQTVIVSDSLKVVLDVAHNPPAFARLLEQVESKFGGHRLHLIIGLASDKDAASILRLVVPVVDHLYIVQSDLARAYCVKDLREALAGVERELGVGPNTKLVIAAEGDGNVRSTLGEVVVKTKTKTKDEPQLIVVAGTFGIMADALSFLEVPEFSALQPDPKKLSEAFHASTDPTKY